MTNNMDAATIGLLTEAGRERTGSSGEYQRLETVLIIEDHADLNRALTFRLQHAGLNVACAYDGLAGLEKIRHLAPDVIVLDIHLPRLHGFKLLHRLRQEPNLRDAPIVAITGDPTLEVEERALRWGVKRVFRKPVSASELVSSVLDLIGGY